MYSYEDRIRAVKLYIKLGKRLTAIIRQLGDSTKNSLKGRYREYEQNRDLQVDEARPMQKYSAEQMQVAVQHYLDDDRCIALTMRALGYHAGQYSLGGLMNGTLRLVIVWWACTECPASRGAQDCGSNRALCPED